MVTDERKGELMADLEYAVNRYLDKQWVVAELVEDVAVNDEERTFLNSLNSYFAVMLPEEN